MQPGLFVIPENNKKHKCTTTSDESTAQPTDNVNNHCKARGHYKAPLHLTGQL